MAKFSVCMSIYKNDSLAYFKIAFTSILNQSVNPNEIVIVIDGPVYADIYDYVELQSRLHAIVKVIFLPENKGLGNALKTAIESASYELIARMDSDDISLPDRFEQQLKCFEENDELSVVGGAISEFIDFPENIVASRVCPLTDREIKQYMRTRCGLNHMTVMFKKSEVIKAGNYLDWFQNEDYYLWVRMMLSGCKFQNLDDILVNVRVGKDMYARRGGMKYFISEVRLQKFMLQNHIITLPLFIFNVSIRWIVQILLPNSVRGFVFRKLFRNNVLKNKK